MNEQAILDDINRLLHDRLGIARELGPEARLRTDLQLDSMALLTLVFELESHFRIRFDETDERALDRMGDLVQLVARRLAERAP